MIDSNDVFLIIDNEKVNIEIITWEDESYVQ